MSVVHLAGNHVCIGGRVIQRCLVCGYKLIDVDASRCMVASTKPEDLTIKSFGVGHLIEVDGNHSSDIGNTLDPHFDQPWDNCCLELVEE